MNGTFIYSFIIETNTCFVTLDVALILALETLLLKMLLCIKSFLIQIWNLENLNLKTFCIFSVMDHGSERKLIFDFVLFHGFLVCLHNIKLYFVETRHFWIFCKSSG